MKEIINYLTQLDFSKPEIKLYLILLRFGSMSVTELAQRAKINRTSAYTYIDALFKKGVLIKTKGSRNQISATSPENLKYIVESKANQIRSLEIQLPSVIKSLNNSFSSANLKEGSEIKYYKGRLGARVIYEECLKAKELRSYFNAAEVESVFPGNLDLFNEALVINPNIIMYEILENSVVARKQVFNYSKSERYAYKFFPPDVELFANDILIYDGKVAIINVRNKNNIHGVIMSNEDYYNNSKLLFDLLWKLLPDPK